MATLLELYKEAVARGVVYLDEHVPNWHTKINLGKLNMADMDNCIAGQLGISDHTYTAKIERAACGRLGMAGELGFYSDGLKSFKTAEGYCRNVKFNDQLFKSVWVDVINQRLAA